mmetsp:Transcript_17754/g.32075  ORF Transcript_17754/g.32075 Transcript_17754/m.32075 type:complete len:219 (+) Transcript_17754:243-899(+)
MNRGSAATAALGPRNLRRTLLRLPKVLIIIAATVVLFFGKRTSTLNLILNALRQRVFFSANAIIAGIRHYIARGSVVAITCIVQIKVHFVRKTFFCYWASEVIRTMGIECIAEFGMVCRGGIGDGIIVVGAAIVIVVVIVVFAHGRAIVHRPPRLAQRILDHDGHLILGHVAIILLTSIATPAHYFVKTDLMIEAGRCGIFRKGIVGQCGIIAGEGGV